MRRGKSSHKTRRRTGVLLVACFLMLSALVSSAHSTVDLVWVPEYQEVVPGQTVSVDLYAVSAIGVGQLLSALDVIILHNPDLLSFEGTSPIGSYEWQLTGFLSPSPGGINDDLYDGDLLFNAWAKLGVPAIATPEGLPIKRFIFKAGNHPATANVTIPAEFGTARTRVFSGSVPNLDIKGNLGSTEIVITDLVMVGSAAELRQLPDGTKVSVTGPVVTRIFPEGFFYVQDASRAAGIRVNCSADSLPPAGSMPTIVGTLATINGERVVDQAVITPGQMSDIPRELVMNTRSAVCQAGLCPQALLVRIAGYPIAVDGEEGEYVLSDGGKTDLRLDLYDVHLPSGNTLVQITGVIGMDEGGPLLRVIGQENIQPVSTP